MGRKNVVPKKQKHIPVYEDTPADDPTGLCVCCCRLRPDSLSASLDTKAPTQLSATACADCEAQAKESSGRGKKDKRDKKGRHNHADPAARPSGPLMACLHCAYTACDSHCFRHHTDHSGNKKPHNLFLLLDDAAQAHNFKAKCYRCDLDVSEDKAVPSAPRFEEEEEEWGEGGAEVCEHQLELTDEGYVDAPPAELNTRFLTACSMVVERMADAGGGALRYSGASATSRQKGGKSRDKKRLRQQARQQQHNGFGKSKWGGRASVCDPIARENGLKGLCNFGNTCFFNSAVQALCAAPTLQQHLKRLERDELAGRVTLGSLTATTVGFSLKLLDVDAIAVTAQLRMLHTEVQRLGPQFRGNEQHDTHELVRFLLDTIGMEFVNEAKKNPKDDAADADAAEAEDAEPQGGPAGEGDGSGGGACSPLGANPFTHLFSGQLRSTVQCGQCLSKSSTLEDYHDLSVTVTKSLQESLDLFFEQETLEGRSYTCPKCNKDQHDRLQARKEEERRLALQRLDEQEKEHHAVSLREVIETKPDEDDAEENDNDNEEDEEAEEDAGATADTPSPPAPPSEEDEGAAAPPPPAGATAAPSAVPTAAAPEADADAGAEAPADAAPGSSDGAEGGAGGECGAAALPKQGAVPNGGGAGRQDGGKDAKKAEQQRSSGAAATQSPQKGAGGKRKGGGDVVRTDAYKQYSVVRESRCVAIHLKRFYFCRRTISYAKDKTHVEIPDTITLSDYTEEEGASADATYSLYATIEHQGEVGYGHYVAYVKKNGRWFECNDSWVSQSSRSAATRMPYVVFYTKG